MENKVQEITEKIYNEGVAKGKAEAQKIIETAEAQKTEILKNAQQEAKKIIADAQKSVEELTRHTHAELQIYAGRAVEALKSEIANLVSRTIVDTAINETVNNEWLQKLMLSLASDWVTKENIIIQSADAASLTQYFAVQAKHLLDKGVKIEQVNGKTAGFVIMPVDKAYRVQFGEAEFAAYFKEFIRPQLVKMLFQ